MKFKVSSSSFPAMLHLIPWLHALALLSVILQPSQPAAFLGRYSTIAFVVLVILLVTLPVAWWGARWFSRQALARLPAPAFGAGLVICVLGAAVAGWLTALPTLSYVVVSLYVLYLVVAAALRVMAAVASPLAGRTFAEVALGALLVLVVIAQLFLAARFPGQLWTDEGYNTALSLSIARNGEIAVPIFRLVPELYGPNYSLTYFMTGAALNTFGVELAVARWVVFVIGLAAIGLTGYVAARLYAPTIGIGAALVAAVVLLPNNYFRADVEVAFWLAVAFWALWQEERLERAQWALLAGWAVGFSLDGHPTAYRFILILLAFEGISWLMECLRTRRLILKHRVFVIGFGAFLGAGSYVLLYSTFVPDAFGRRLGEASIGFDPGKLLPLLETQVLSALRNWTLLFGMAVLGAIVGLRSSRQWERRLVVVAVGSLFVFGLTYNYYRDYYAVHLLPVYILLAACGLDALRRVAHPDVNHELHAGAATAGVVLLLGIAAASWQAQRVVANRGQDYSAARIVADAMRPWVAQDAVLLGVDPLYLRMSDYPNFVEFNTGPALALYRGISEANAWKDIAPDAVAIFHDYPIPPPESLLEYVRDIAMVRVACWEGMNIGQVDLYLRVVPQGAEPPTACVVVGS